MSLLSIFLFVHENKIALNTMVTKVTRFKYILCTYSHLAECYITFYLQIDKQNYNSTLMILFRYHLKLYLTKTFEDCLKLSTLNIVLQVWQDMYNFPIS